MFARDHMDDGFVCAYADILYRPDIVERFVRSEHEITLVCDTDWRTRYAQRTEHPEDDGEKIVLNGDATIASVNRDMASEDAFGEYIGVARFDREGAGKLCDYYARAKEEYGDGPFRAARHFRKAYLIDLFQHMIEGGVAMHAMATDGGYMEIDTNQDFRIAREEWEI